MVFIRYIVLVVSFWVLSSFQQIRKSQQIRFSECWRESAVHFPACNADHRVRSFWLIPFASPSESVVGKQAQSFFPSCNASMYIGVYLWGKKSLVYSGFSAIWFCASGQFRENNIGQKCSTSVFIRYS